MFERTQSRLVILYYVLVMLLFIPELLLHDQVYIYMYVHIGCKNYSQKGFDNVFLIGYCMTLCFYLELAKGAKVYPASGRRSSKWVPMEDLG